MSERLRLTASLEAWIAFAAIGFAGILLGLAAGFEPAVAIVVAVAASFAGVVVADLTTGLLLFVGILFLEALLPGGGELTLTKLAGLLLAVSWLARVTTRRDEDNFLGAHPAATYLLLAFLGWAVFSLTWATDTAAGIGDLSRYGLNILLYVIVYSAVRTEEQGVRVVWAIVLGTGATALLGFVVGNSEARPQDDRLASTVGNANELAAVLVAGVALAAGLGFSLRKSSGLRLLALPITVVSLFALVLTGSRSGVIALALSLVTFVCFAGRWRPQAVFGVVSASLAVIVLFFAFAPEPVRQRITEITPGEVSASQEGRVSIWMAAARMVEDNPVKGVGVGNFQTRAKDYVLEPGAAGRTDQVIDDPQIAHNTYLQVLAELGIIGVIPFLAIIVFSLAAAYSAVRRFERLGNLRLEILSRSLIVAVIGTLAANFFASEQFNKLFWLLMALGPAFLAIARRQEQARAADPVAEPAAGADPPQRVLASL